MSTYEHGIISSEKATSVTKSTTIESAVGVIFGTAPINLLDNPYSATNQPILITSYNEAIEKIGFSFDFKNYTLCQSIYIRFKKFYMAPIVVVNVLNPEVHIKEVEPASFNIVNKKVEINEQGILLDKIVVKSSDSNTTYVSGTDYTAAFTDDGTVVIAMIASGSIGSATAIQISYTKIDPSKVTKADIIGGYNTSTRKSSGIDCVSLVYPRLGMVPCQLLAPGWSHIPTVAAVLSSKTKLINGLFNAISITDIDTEAVKSIDDLQEYKNSNGHNDLYNLPCYPKVIVDGYEIYYSAVADAVIAATDNKNNGPYASPSNKEIYIDGTCYEGGEEIFFDMSEANEINAAGIMTALNLNGWRSWGNEMGCYPDHTDVKDRFIVCRRVYNFRDNWFKVNFFANVDDPMNYRLIEAIVNQENLILSTLAAQGMIAGGSIEFDVDENPTANLLDGHIIFHRKLSPFTPAKVIETVTEFDPTLNSAALTGGE